MFAIGIGIIQHPGVAQGLLLTLFPAVIGLGGEHMSIVFRDQQGFAGIRCHVLFCLDTRRGAVVGEIVVGVDILQQMALFQIPHAGGGPAGIQPVGQGIGAGVQLVIVLTLVDAHPPQHNGRVAPVLQNHLPHILHRLINPVLAADVLPAGDFGEHQQTAAVAFIQEILALGIVAGADRVAAQLLLQNAGILPLHGFRGGVAHIGEALMAVEAPQEGLFAVEIKPVPPEFRRAETEGGAAAIQLAAIGGQQYRGAGVQRGAFRVPRGGVGHLGGKAGFSGALFFLPDHRPRPGAQLHPNPGIRRGAVQGQLDAGGMGGGRGHIDVLHQRRAPQIQPGLPVQSAVGQIVYDKAEGWNGGILGGVQLHGDPVFTGPEQFRNLGPESGVAAAVAGSLPAVDIQCGDVTGTVKLKKHPFAQIFREGQGAPVAADHLVAVAVRKVQGHLLAGVRQGYLLCGQPEVEEILAPLFGKFPGAANAVFHRVFSLIPFIRMSIMASSSAA